MRSSFKRDTIYGTGHKIKRGRHCHFLVASFVPTRFSFVPEEIDNLACSNPYSIPSISEVVVPVSG
jgi:hypothetical protein